VRTTCSTERFKREVEEAAESLEISGWISREITLKYMLLALDRRECRLIRDELENVDFTPTETSRSSRQEHARPQPEGRKTTRGSALLLFYSVLFPPPPLSPFINMRNLNLEKTTNTCHGANALETWRASTGLCPPLSSIPQSCGRAGRFVFSAPFPPPPLSLQLVWCLAYCWAGRRRCVLLQASRCV
jgi:hypothetical protein